MYFQASKIQEKIFNIDIFNQKEVALELFNFQYNHNLVYKQFVDYLNIQPNSIDCIEKIPFLPIEFFKSHKILLENVEAVKVFESSGTTGQITSKHLVADLMLYEKSFIAGFNHFYGNPSDWIILALLPSYLERNNSSLVYMVETLIRLSNAPESGFYLDNFDDLATLLISLKQSSKKIVLIGVTFALLDFAEQYQIDLSHIIIMETGGMKGRREELTRTEVHTLLQNAFNINTIHSEYGMTELLSQAYSFGNGIFESPNWLKILKRDIYNPLQTSASIGRGALNIIDFANIYSCAFIATQDLVNILNEKQFEVLGRLDNSDIRGCNLMVTNF